MSNHPSHLRAKQPLREQISTLRNRAIRGVSIPVRRAFYVDQPAWTRLLRLIPKRWRSALGIDDAAGIGSRKLELGAGPHPQPGYIHADADWTGNHLEFIAPAWHLPLPDDWAEEIAAIHMFEHLHPRDVSRTLAEWRRVLMPGGRVQIHVPNARPLMESFLAAEPVDKWRFINALLGMYSAPETSDPQQVITSADHQLLLDWPLAEYLFIQAGFVHVSDLTTQVRDRHTEAWEPFVGSFSLVLEALNPRD